MRRHLTINLALLMMLGSQVGAKEANNPTVLSGTVTQVRDDDTIEVDGVAVRLSALDCRENNTQQGNLATQIAQQFQETQAPCELTGAKSYRSAGMG